MRNLARSAIVKNSTTGLTMALICVVFFISGFPALVYQLIWQRSLFIIYGINIESVTIVVTGFMLGLGLGSLFGGFLSKHKPLPLLVMFGCIELGIGAFGSYSLELFHTVGVATLHSSPFVLKVAPLLLLLVPTLLMGSTLPILVMYLVERSGNVGKSVGLLYFLNTLGSAIACFVIALWMMRVLGMQSSVLLAACFNLTVGAVAFVAWKKDKHQHARSETQNQVEYRSPRLIGFGLTLAFSMGVGCLSLSYELVWFRFFSFLTGASAMAFALILGAFLVGVATGSFAGSIMCRRAEHNDFLLLRVLGTIVLFSSLLGFFYAPIIAQIMERGVSKYIYLPTILLFVAVIAGLMGAALPLLSHLGIAANSSTGARLSYLYLANILGSVIGSLGTGFVLMDYMNFAEISALLAIAGLALGVVVLLSSHRRRTQVDFLMVASAALGIAVIPFASPLFTNVWDTLLFHYGSEEVFDVNERVIETAENKHGVINVSNDDRVYGGGMYDGMIRVDLAEDPNGLERPFALSFFHPSPKDVLMIGLATGAWAQVIANHPQVEKLTIVEINPGYLELISKHKQVASLLANPKVAIVIDDGRRWLVRHPEQKFDAIIQNTTWFFRANTTNLLSEEYIRLSLSHLKEGGIDMYNTTSSDRAQRTACAIAPNSIRLMNQMIVSNTPMTLDRERWYDVLLSYKIDGKPMIDSSNEARLAHLNDDLQFVENQAPPATLETCGSIMKRTASLRTMTDDNMGEEWHYLRRRKIFGE
jgi:spermidine synthase